MKLLLLFLSFSAFGQNLYIKFVAKPEHQSGIEEYESVWTENKEVILKLTKKYTGLEFDEDKGFIKAILINGPSYSGVPYKAPMRLRYNYPVEVKLATLIHELGHRLVYKITKKHPDLDTHDILFLFLYDIWVDLKNEDFANRMVVVESRRAPRYKKLWNKALSIDKEKRAKKLKSFLEVVK